MHNSEKPTVGIIVDHPLRDLGGCTLIATELAKHGVRAVLIPMAFQEEGSFLFAPNLVMVNYIRNNNLHFIQKMYDCGIKVSLLDTEGGFYGDLSKYTKVLCTTDGVLDGLDHIFVWGHAMDDYWKKTINVRAEQVKLTGVARFDLYHPQVMQNLNLQGQISKSLTNVVLFNTKVALANPQFQSVDKEKMLYKKLGFSDEEIENIYAKGIQYIGELTELIRATARTFPTHSLVVRPHPHENTETYRTRLNGFSNTHVNRTGDFLNWLPRSKVIVHRHCTTAIEAALSGVPAISPQWIPTSSNLPDGEALSYRPQSQAEFLELIETAVTSQLPLPSYAENVIERTIHDWLFKFDGQSHRRVAAEVLASISAPKKTSIDKCNRYLKEIFSRRSGLTGALLHFSEKNPVTSKLLRTLKVKKWQRSAKSFNLEQTKEFIFKTENVNVYGIDDVYIVFE